MYIMTGANKRAKSGGGCLRTLFKLVIGVSVAGFGVAVYQHEKVCSYVFPLPAKKDAFPYGDEMWTTTQKNIPASEEIKPFKLDVPESVLDDLKSRLKNTRYGSAMPGVNFEYGFPEDQLRKVVDYWQDKYDWRKQEKIINQYNQYKTNIEGLDVHFVRVQPKTAEKNIKIVPIILMHGWPGSFYELYKVIPLLVKPRQTSSGEYVAFEVIVPSLPGYGFSEAPQKPGLNPQHIARMFNKLMARLNHNKYFIWGSDWGSSVCRNMAIMYPERVTGIDVSMYPIDFKIQALKNIPALIFPSLILDPKDSHKLIFNNVKSLLRETGYMHLQATKPDTVGTALLDSPAGLAAYILEKFSTWTNANNINLPDGGLQKYFSLDDLLNNIMVYWVSGSIMTSQRLYKENFASEAAAGAFRFPVEVPTVLSDFRNDIPGANPPDSFVRPYFTDLVKISMHETGGHFPALERPVEVAEDIWILANAVLTRTTQSSIPPPNKEQ